MAFKLPRAARNQRGMTLIEIVIAILILVFISMATAFNIRSSVKKKAIIERDLDDYAAVRDALIIMTKDVNTAFHYVDPNEAIQKKISEEAAAAGKPPPFPSPPPQSNAVDTAKLTGFEGAADHLYLTTLSHVRTITDSQESDQAKVGYYLKDVRSTKDGNQTKALIRKEATFLDGSDLDKGGRETVLLENVTQLKFRYLGGDDKDWTESWKSTTADGDATHNKFPDAVEITIMTDHGGRKVSLSTVAAIHMTANDLFQPPSPTPGPGGAAGQAFGAGAGGFGAPPMGGQPVGQPPR